MAGDGARVRVLARRISVPTRDDVGGSRGVVSGRLPLWPNDFACRFSGDARVQSRRHPDAAVSVVCTVGPLVCGSVMMDVAGVGDVGACRAHARARARWRALGPGFRCSVASLVTGEAFDPRRTRPPLSGTRRTH